MIQVALWRVYILGRFGEERELGFVIASARDQDWLSRHTLAIQPWVACDIVQKIEDYKDGKKENASN